MAAEALCEWGLHGIGALHARVAVLVVVDVLSFCTAVDVAVARGAVVHPFPFGEEAAARTEAARLGAVHARPRRAADGQFSLSPASLLAIAPGTKLLLPSPNGARLGFAAGCTPGRTTVLAGCLRNASAVARTARALAAGGAVGVVPAGERWPDDTARFAIEDLLGAGAVLDALGGDLSPEAEVARDAFRSARGDLSRLLRLSVSGRELVDGGFPGDVDLAAQHDVSAVAPLLTDGAFRGVG